VNWILTLSMEIRLIVLFIVGTLLGVLVNLAAYYLAWNRRPISPWMKAHPAAPARRRFDRLPILGWLVLSREHTVHGSGFWIRPMLLELFCGMGLAGLYYWEVGMAALFPPDILLTINPELLPAFQSILHLQFFSHAILFSLMLAASLVDIDEKTIPDAICRPGTILGLVLAAAWQWSLLPDVFPISAQEYNIDFLHITSPNAWPEYLNGAPHVLSLGIALACWILWCLAIMPRTWYPRHGWDRALALCRARLARMLDTYLVLCMCLLGVLFIAGVWYRGQNAWAGLITALVGMAVGGGITWTVRAIGKTVLGQEAMGFGDVTLMCMIGAFVGWQACLPIFFLAALPALVAYPFLALRKREIYYGPFLCLTTAFLILYWNTFWNAVRERIVGLFELGWLLPLILLSVVLIMVLLLFLIRAIFDFIRNRLET
jgi:leader peptidase (prepilin peptidase) / N-methyltransferase